MSRAQELRMTCDKPAGINIIGRPRLPCSVSISTIAVIEALMRGGVDVVVYEIAGELEDRQLENVPPYRTVEAIADLPYTTTFVLDIPLALLKILAATRGTLASHQFATIFSWEFERIEPTWLEQLAAIDRWFAPSRFVQASIEYSLGVPATFVPITPLFACENPEPARTKLLRSEDTPFTFYLNFDVLSGLERKNPSLAIDAFVTAFGGRDDTRLIVKSWQSGAFRLADHNVGELQKRHANIQVVTDSLSYQDNLALIQSCDAYISLHRAEGLGLGLLESMSFGIPVLGTNYSASTDYLDENSGVPIPYQRVPVHPNRIGPVHELDYWAQPDLAATVAAMRRIRDDREYYLNVSRGARRRYEERRRQFLSLEWLACLAPQSGQFYRSLEQCA